MSSGAGITWRRSTPSFTGTSSSSSTGEIYSGETLDPKTRALCTVAMRAAPDQQLQLGVYVRSARRQGASEEEIREVLRQVSVYAGFPSAWNALATMRAALAEYEESP
jgi:4-carboxymuconolactone decarboxylase